MKTALVLLVALLVPVGFDAPNCPVETEATQYALVVIEGETYAAALTEEGEVPNTVCWMKDAS